MSLRGRLGRGALAAALVGGCAEAPPEDPTGEPPSTEDPPPPRLLVGGGELVIPTDRTAALEIRATGVIPGVTEVQLGGRSLGPLFPATELGSLTAETLTLELHGAMIAGLRTLRLVNPSDEADNDNDGDEDSGDESGGSSVLLTLVATGHAPSFSAEEVATAGPGSGLTVDGRGPAALLTVVDSTADPTAEPVARIFRREGGGWDPSPRTLPLPGYAPLAGSAAPAVSASSDDAGLRVAWRAGSGGQTITAASGLPWDDDSPGSPQALATAPQPIDGGGGVGGGGVGGGGVEWVAYGRPRFLGDDLLFEVTALVDSESSRPGDHRLAQLRWPRGGDPTPPFEVTTAEVVDLEHLGPGLDLTAPHQPIAELRAAARYPALIRGGGTVASLAINRRAPLPGATSIHTVTSSLGTQTSLGVTADGTLLTATYDVLSREAKTWRLSPEDAELPPPTGAPSATVAAGLAIFALPYGPAAWVELAVFQGRETFQLYPLEGVSCDALALTVDSPEAGEFPLACVIDGEVIFYRVTVSVEP